MKNSRSTSDTQLAQAGFSLQAAVGSFDSAANSIALTKHLGVFFTPSAGKAALFGRVVQAIPIAAFFDGTLIDKFALAARRGGHHGFCFAGLSVVH